MSSGMSVPAIELSCGAARATISTLGAECTAWSVGGSAMLWTRDPGIWDGTAPILFPVCGWSNASTIHVDGVAYPMDVHGFARTMHFDVREQSSSHVILCLRDSATTWRHFPYAFELSVSYRLAERVLAIELAVRNPGGIVMPYALGLHPGFSFDAACGSEIRFDRPEIALVPVITEGGLFSSQRRRLEFDGHRLPILPETFSREAICFVPAHSRSLELVEPAGRHLRIDYPGFDNVVLWSRPRAPFLCIEPWTGYGDPKDYQGDLFDKPGMRRLAPGATGRHAATFSVLNA